MRVTAPRITSGSTGRSTTSLRCAGEAEPMALRSIADGRIDVQAWIGERIGLGAVARAVDRMSGPLAPIRSVVDPRRI